jgi:hypothetical protein
MKNYMIGFDEDCQNPIKAPPTPKWLSYFLDLEDFIDDGLCWLFCFIIRETPTLLKLLLDFLYVLILIVSNFLMSPAYAFIKWDEYEKRDKIY